MYVLHTIKSIIILARHIFSVLYIDASIFTSDTHREPFHRNKDHDGSNEINPEDKKEQEYVYPSQRL